MRLGRPPLDVQENFTPIVEDVCGGGERIGYQFCKEPGYKTQRPYFYVLSQSWGWADLR